MVGKLFKPLGPLNYNTFLTPVQTYETKHSGHSSLSNKIVDVPRIHPVNKRAKIDTGKFCNAKCDFCYYKTQLNSKEFLTPEKAREIGEYLIKQGIEEFELSGGEPTASKHFLDIIEVLAEVQKKNNLPVKISVVTNGFLFRHENSKKLRKAQEIVKEWLISVHGLCNEHDDIVGTKGAFYFIDSFIASQKPDCLIRLNIVVTPDTINQTNVDEFMKFLYNKANNNIQLNFLPYNYWSDAGEDDQKLNRTEKEIDKDLLSTYRFINQFFFYIEERSVFPIEWARHGEMRSPLLNIRYAQKCLLSRYARKYNRTTIDHVWDEHDWNRVFYPNDLDSYNYSAEEIYKINNQERLDGTLHPLDVYNQVLAAIRDVCESHTKDDVCSKCPEFSKCDGIKLEENTHENKNFRYSYIKGEIQ